MRVFPLLAAALGLAACAQNPPPSPMTTIAPYSTMPGATPSTFSARPPDNPAGSQQYQSPDLSKRYRPVGGF